MRYDIDNTSESSSEEFFSAEEDLIDAERYGKYLNRNVVSYFTEFNLLWMTQNFYDVNQIFSIFRAAGRYD